VLAGHWLPAGTGAGLVARVRLLHRAARRVLPITWGDQPGMDAVVESTVLGDTDGYAVKPGAAPGERFHSAIHLVHSHLRGS
jgi:hypothetical protein